MVDMYSAAVSTLRALGWQWRVNAWVREPLSNRQYSLFEPSEYALASKADVDRRIKYLSDQITNLREQVQDDAATTAAHVRMLEKRLDDIERRQANQGISRKYP